MTNSTIDTLLVYASWLILPAATIAIGLIAYEEIKARRNPRKRAFKDGQRARKRGASVVANPFPIGSVLGESWRMGWLSVDENTRGEK